MQSTIPRVVALLDEAKDEVEGVESSPIAVDRMHAARAIELITQAQNLLVGGEPTSPEDN